MSQVLGVLAALAAPLVMTIGFYIWEGLWKGSSLNLNIYKGGLATIVFLFIIGFINLSSQQSFLSHGGTSTDIGYLLLSSLIGITIGDTCWLQAMTMIGARRVIVVDVTKPFLAALVGYIGLNEEVGPFLLLGLVLTMSGVALVSFEQTGKKNDKDIRKDGAKEGAKNEENIENKENNKENEKESKKEMESFIETKSKSVQVALEIENNTTTTTATATTTTTATANGTSPSTSKLMAGYVFAFLNVLFDVLGAFLTRKYGSQMTTFDINAVRFGSAAVTLGMVGGIAKTCIARESTLGIGLLGKTNWLENMSTRTWLWISVAVLFVTVGCPALSNWALFQLPLSVCLCLTSVSPLYAIPMSFLVKKEKVTLRAVVGSVVAISGVVVLYIT